MDEVDEPSGVREYAQILWRRRWVIVLVTILALGLSLAYSAVTKRVYQATATLELTPQLPTTLLQANYSNVPFVTVDVPTDLQVLQSGVVAKDVRRSVPNAPGVSVAQVGTTNVVHVSVQSTSPALAAAAANAYAHSYINMQQKQAVDSLTNAAKLMEARLTSVEAAISAVNFQIVAQSGKSDVSGLQTQLSALETEHATLQNERANYEFAASVASGGGQVITLATVPVKPVKPKTVEYAILVGLLGLVLGIGLALILEFFDDGIRTREDLERATHQGPVLGLIPEIDDWRDAHAPYLVTRTAPKSQTAEAYRSLRTSIQFLGLDRPLRTLQFTSPGTGDGKTTSVANLAVTMAQAGLRVVVVCCDLRRPRLHEFFGFSNHVGFTSVLLGKTTLPEAVQAVPGIEGLYLLASGPIPPNPSELLSGARTAELLRSLAANFDIALIDSPPVLPVTDAVVLSSSVDAVVMVVAASHTTRSQARRAQDTLTGVQARLAGFILNRAVESESGSYLAPAEVSMNSDKTADWKVSVVK